MLQGGEDSEMDDPDLPASFTRDFNFGGGPEAIQADGDPNQPPAKRTKREVSCLRFSNYMLPNLKIVCEQELGRSKLFSGFLVTAARSG